MDDVYQSDDNVMNKEISSIQNVSGINEGKGVACVSNNDWNKEVRNLDIEFFDEDVQHTTENVQTQSNIDECIDCINDEVDYLPPQHHTQRIDNVLVESDDDASAKEYSSILSVSSSLRIKNSEQKHK